MKLQIELVDEAATIALGAQLAQVLRAPLLVGLRGDLGAGKTTLVRALINSLVPGTRVKSPTYTLIESYDAGAVRIHHLDLYRLETPEELLQLGLDDVLVDDAIVLVEWPENGGNLLPPPDLAIEMLHADMGRVLSVHCHSPGAKVIGEQLRHLLAIEGGRSGLSS